MSTAASVLGLAFFLAAGGGLRLYLEKRAGPDGTPFEGRFDLAALAALADQLVPGGRDVDGAAAAVAAAVANPATGTLSPEDRQRLARLIAERVRQLQSER